MSIFSVVLFAFALTLSSCGESNADKASVECSAGDDASANVCANTGEACLGDHSCCAVETTEEGATEEVAAEEVATESEDATGSAAEEVATEEESAE